MRENSHRLVFLDETGTTTKMTRRIGARTIDALWKAIGDITALYSEKECWNFFKHAGYASD